MSTWTKKYIRGQKQPDAKGSLKKMDELLFWPILSFASRFMNFMFAICRWQKDFCYRKCPPMFSQILNTVNWILDSFLADQKLLLFISFSKWSDSVIHEKDFKIWDWEFVKPCGEQLIWSGHSIGSRFHKFVFTNFYQ